MENKTTDTPKFRAPIFDELPIRVVCAWKLAPGCTPVIKDGGDTPRVTHGICPACEADMQAAIMIVEQMSR